MKNTSIIVNEHTLQLANEYLQKQFDEKSWWPQAQPHLAKQEFMLMNGSAESLNVWCERWLDAGQCKKLEKAIMLN